MARPVTLFLAGDVMTGRGIDQLFPTSVDPELREPYVRDARDYVTLAEEASGPIARPVAPSYPWGDLLEELDRAAPHARIVNLETSVTTSGRFSPEKDIHYRMHPANVGCLEAARLDVCSLANNHVLDLGPEGLVETLSTLEAAGLRTCGAGRDLEAAGRPAHVPLAGGGAVLVWGLGTASSGIPASWAAAKARPGVDRLPVLSDEDAAGLVRRIRAAKRPGDLVVASIHWGANWVDELPDAHVRFAHRLVDGGVDVVHGHSSHHPLGVEIYRGKLVMYGAGDLVSDYEGIRGHDAYRGELRLAWLATLDGGSGALLELRALALESRKLALRRASPAEARWLADALTASGRRFGTRWFPVGPDRMQAAWDEGVLLP